MQPTEKYYEHDAYRREAVGHILAAEPDSRTGGGRIALDDRGALTMRRTRPERNKENP